jgi:hypothetical protein
MFTSGGNQNFDPQFVSGLDIGGYAIRAMRGDQQQTLLVAFACRHVLMGR